MRITWLGHNAWAIDAGGVKLLVDPFLDGSSTSPVNAADVEADFVLLSHGHGDHLGDTVAIAKRTGATVLTAYEISLWLAGQGVPADHCVGMNPGGGYDLPPFNSEEGGRIKMTPAHHSSSLPDGTYAGVAMGLDLTLGGKRVYFACDTSLMPDMTLIGDPAISGAPLDLAVLPIGDLFTMGPRGRGRGDQTAGAQKGRPLPLQHVPADRAGRVGLGRPGPRRDRRRADRPRARRLHHAMMVSRKGAKAQRSRNLPLRLCVRPRPLCRQEK